MTVSLNAVLGRLVTPKCSTPTAKISRYIDCIAKAIMRERWSYIKDFGDFIEKIKTICEIPREL